MKTPWFNYREMKRVSIARQNVFFFTVAQEQDEFPSDDSKNRVSATTDSDHHDLDISHSGVNPEEINNPNDNLDENHVLDRHRKNDEFKEMSVCKVVKKIKEVQTNIASDIRSLPIDCSTEDNYFEKISDFVNLKKVNQTGVTCETDNNLQGKSGFIHEYISKSNPASAPRNIESVIIVKVLEDLEITRILEPSPQKDESIKFGISQLVNVLNKLQPIHANDPFELLIEPNSPVIGVSVEIDPIIDSQIECEPVHISKADVPLGYIELDKSTSLVEDTDSPNVIELDEENSESKQMGIYRLVNTLQKLQPIHTDDPFELSNEPNAPVIDEAAEIAAIIDLQIECEPVHIPVADAPLGYIQVEKLTSLLENTDSPNVIELDEENSESKQIGIYRLVNTLQKLQPIHTDDPFELLNEPNSLVIDEATEIAAIIDSQIECEPVHIPVADAPLAYIQVDKLTSLVEDTDSPNVIELDEENSETKQKNVYRLVNTLQKLQLIHTDDPFELSMEYNLPVIDKVNEKFDRDEANKSEPTKAMEEFLQCGKMYCRTIKSPFSTFVEIDNFLHAPIFGEISKNTFEFLDPSNKQNFQLDTKFISTSTYYPEQPSCHLVSSKIHELIYVTNALHTNETKKNKDNSVKSNMIPLHPSPKTGESSHANYIRDFIKIRVPVVVGEYNIEISIEEVVLFEEEVIRIKEVSKNVVLTNCNFLPTQLSKPLGDGTCAATNGVLSLEGVIVQNIEYSTMSDKTKSSIKRREAINLHEKITVELTIQLLQEQGIRVNYNDIKNY